MKIISNKGSATIEATLILPLFVFGVMVLFYGVRLRMAEAVLYEAATETVEYMAELSYISECNSLVPKAKIVEYLDNDSLVENYIIGGINGVDFQGSRYLDDEGYVCLVVNYRIGINVPVIGELCGDRSYEIRQKAYKGDKPRDEENELTADEVYVYITDNKEAYHNSRGCSHLDLSITPMSKDRAKATGYSPCEYCGSEANGAVLVTTYGDRYHSRGDCTGLKRTVYRVKKSQVEGLGACKRCVD